MYNYYRGMGTKGEQISVLLNYSTRIKVQRRRKNKKTLRDIRVGTSGSIPDPIIADNNVKKNIDNIQYTYRYFLPENEGRKISVCKLMFLNTINIRHY